MYKVEVGKAVKKLISDVVALKNNNDHNGVMERLKEMCESPNEVMEAMSHFDTDEEIIYVDDEVSVYYLATTPKILYPPHEHGMEAISAIYKGTETHIFYDRDGENVKKRSQVRFQAPAVVDMTVETVHAILNEDKEPNESLHFYFGDLVTQKRTLWDADGKNPQQYIQANYDSFERQMD